MFKYKGLYISHIFCRIISSFKWVFGTNQGIIGLFSERNSRVMIGKHQRENDERSNKARSLMTRWKRRGEELSWLQHLEGGNTEPYLLSHAWLNYKPLFSPPSNFLRRKLIKIREKNPPPQTMPSMPPSIYWSSNKNEGLGVNSGVPKWSHILFGNVNLLKTSPNVGIDFWKAEI